MVNLVLRNQFNKAILPRNIVTIQLKFIEQT